MNTAEAETGPAGTWLGAVRSRTLSFFYMMLDLLATEYVQEVEIPKAISRHDLGEATVLPAILGLVLGSATHWASSKLSQRRAARFKTMCGPEQSTTSGRR